MNTKLPPGTLEKLWRDPDSWRAHFFYFCKADPRAIVPKRGKWSGWTMNCAHLSGWITCMLLLTYILIPVLLIKRYDLVTTWIGTLTLSTVILSTIALCCFFSSPKRFEEDNSEANE